MVNHPIRRFKSEEERLDYEYRHRQAYNAYYRRLHPDYTKEWRKQNPDKWRQIKKNHEKRYHLKWVLKYPNPFDDSELVEEHHVDDEYIVYLPKDLHHLAGEYSGRNIEYHRINLSYIVEQIYGELICPTV